jgi:hypothetical protein
LLLSIPHQIANFSRIRFSVMEPAAKAPFGNNGGNRRLRLGEIAMTVAELIEKLSALSDKAARVVKSPGPWDGLNEPSQVYDGYLDKDLHLPVLATDPDAIHVVYL